MHITTLTKSLVMLALLLAMASVEVVAQDNDAIGKILISRGGVEAISPDGESRLLRRRSDVFAQDRIITDDSGFAQIRLVDSAIIALKENTEFVFKEYDF